LIYKKKLLNFLKDTGIGISIEQQSTVLKDLYRSISKTFRHVRRRFRLAISKALFSYYGEFGLKARKE
jgi:hypothetical protein